ncbi:STAS domain-containing protein [Nonomuraea sp. SBT364]|uniref:STAS domain-containing protein n=1 Tax=Nonomuraea sp. SBT364 TaxID=1580530 RepID=UPI0018CF7539|nr:STAS domain-containing protein [Nonomuraea sp. SBT364]
MADLSVEVERGEGVTTVRLAGDLDKLTAPGFKECLASLSDEGRFDVVVDALGLEFCDSSGLWVLVELQRAVGERGGGLQLTGVHGVLRRVLDVTGLKAVFDGVLPAQL